MLKFLVCYLQSFEIKSDISIITHEKITCVLKARSARDLLLEFEKIDFIPNHILLIQQGRELISHKKIFLWFIPQKTPLGYDIDIKGERRICPCVPYTSSIFKHALKT